MESQHNAPDAVAARIEELLGAGNTEAAQAALDEASANGLDPVRRHVLSGHLQLARGEIKAALVEFRSAVRLAPDDADAIHGRADMLFRLGRKQRARLVLWRATRRDHADPRLWSGRASVASALSEPKRAERILRRARESAADDQALLQQHVAILRRIQRYDKARTEINQAIERHPEDAELHFLLGMVELDDQQLEAAAARFESAWQIDASRLDAVSHQSQCLRVLGKSAAAQVLMEQAIGEDADTDDSGLIGELALIHFYRADVEKAERLWRRAVPSEPVDASHALNLAYLLERQGRLDEANAALCDALAQAPVNRPLLMRLAAITADRHDYTGAAAYYERALAIHKDWGTRKGLWRARWAAGRVPLVGGVLRSIDRQTRRRYDGFRPVLSLLDELLETDGARPSRSLRTRAVRLVWQLARTGAILEWLVGNVYVVYFLVLSLAFGGVPVRVGGTDGPGPEPFSEYLIVGVLYFLALAVGSFFTAWVLSERRSLSFLIRLLACAAVPAAAAGLLSQVRDHAADNLVAPLLWAATGFAVGSTLLMALLMLLVFLEYVVRGRARREDPYAVAVISLLRALFVLRGGVDPVDRSDLHSVVTALEEAAAGIHDHLHALEPTGDIRSDAWLSERANGIAAALRNLKGWVLSPGAESFDALARRIEVDLRNIAIGRWRELPWIDPAVAAARARRLRVIASARSLLFATVPLGACLVASSWGLVEGQTADQFLFASVLWGVVSVLITLDPAFSDKLGAYRQVQGSLKQETPRSGPGG